MLIAAHRAGLVTTATVALVGAAFSVATADHDRSGSGGKGNILICHVPPGNPPAAQTLEIGELAWGAHEAHGDTEGACDGDVAADDCPDEHAAAENETDCPVEEDPDERPELDAWPHQDNATDRPDEQPHRPERADQCPDGDHASECPGERPGQSERPEDPEDPDACPEAPPEDEPEGSDPQPGRGNDGDDRGRGRGGG